MEDTKFLNKAIEWYKSGGKQLRRAALELFSEDELKKEIDNRNNERYSNAENDLMSIYETAKEMFPIGSLINSDDGTDMLLNITISEPYIENDIKFRSSGASKRYKMSDTDRKSVFVKTVRLYNGELVKHNGKICISTVCLENVIDTNKKDGVRHKDVFVDPNKYLNNELNMKSDLLYTYNKEKNEHIEKIKMVNEKIEELNKYNPFLINDDFINSVIKQVNDEL